MPCQPLSRPQKWEVAGKHTRPGHLFPSMAHEGSGGCPAPHWCPGFPLLFLVTVALISISLLAAEVQFHFFQSLVCLSLLCFLDASIQHPSLCFLGTVCLAEDSGSWGSFHGCWAPVWTSLPSSLCGTIPGEM